MGYLDPKPDQPHSICRDCEAEFVDRPSMTKHLVEFKHGARITNPSRPERIRSEVGRIVSDTLDETAYEFIRMMDRDEVTKEEMNHALTLYPDFHEAWEDALAEDDE